MAKNFVAPGNVLDHVAAGDIVSGQVVKIGDVVGIAVAGASSGQDVALSVAGRYRVPKVPGTAWGQGDALDWDASESAFGFDITPEAGDVLRAGFAAAPAAAGDTVADVVLSPQSAEAA